MKKNYFLMEKTLLNFSKYNKYYSNLGTDNLNLNNYNKKW